MVDVTLKDVGKKKKNFEEISLGRDCEDRKEEDHFRMSDQHVCCGHDNIAHIAPFNTTVFCLRQ